MSYDHASETREPWSYSAITASTLPHRQGSAIWHNSGVPRMGSCKSDLEETTTRFL